MRVQAKLRSADSGRMDRRVLTLCILGGSIVGGFLPELWGASAFGAASLLLSAIGGIAGVFVAARIGESL